MNKVNQFAGLLLLIVLSACSRVAPSAVDNQPQAIKSKPISQLVATCAACHGQNGISVNEQWPNLAGQQSDYLLQELRSFRDGKRQNALMTSSLLASLSDEDLGNIASHYAKIQPLKKQIQGINELPGAHVRARCVSCHGMTGQSVTGLWPNVAGQKAGYLAKQLLDYKKGVRVHGTMQVIASELTEQQIQDVAYYYSMQ
ncbi:MAG: cytochrome c4 [Arenicella sp.]|nr:cytochrome c4 [Arenicella sp.]